MKKLFDALWDRLKLASYGVILIAIAVGLAAVNIYFPPADLFSALVLIVSIPIIIVTLLLGFAALAAALDEAG